MKKCNRCGIEKELDYFHRTRVTKDGRNTICKECKKISTNIYRNENKEKVRKLGKQNREKHKEKIAEYNRNYYLENKEKIRERNLRWRAINPEKCEEIQQRYRERNKEKYNEYQRDYRHRRFREDPNYKMSFFVSRKVRRAIKESHGRKAGSTWEHLPYTPNELRAHLENQFDENMSWENHGDYWHIDHIVPQAALPFDSLKHPNFLKCWALENLRPLKASDNWSKGSLHEGIRHRYGVDN